MLERKLYKTKLCILYQRGRCPRQSCSFAHGDAELRRFSASFSGRRDYRGNDLRERLDKWRSPPRRLSPGRDARGRHAFRSQKLSPYDRAYIHSRSPVERRERRHQRRQHLSGQSDVSGSLKNSDGSEDPIREGKDKDALEDQLKREQLDIDMLDDHKSQLEMALEEKVQEANGLTMRIQELEAQLSREEEECKRITSKIKKFVKAHNRCARAQADLKRMQTRLQRLGDELGPDISRRAQTEEDSSINIVSEAETEEDYDACPTNDVKNKLTSYRKRTHVSQGVGEENKSVSSKIRDGLFGRTFRSDKLSRGDEVLSDSNKMEAELASKAPVPNNVLKLVSNENKHKRRKNDSSSISSLEKVKGSDTVHQVPSTSMAAHAVDDLIEAMDHEEKLESGKITTVLPNGKIDDKGGLSFLPPPPAIPQNAYNQYEGEDEDVDVADVDMDAGDADINSEVEIVRV